MLNKLWHDSRERPKDGSSILIVHDKFNYGKDEVTKACYYEDYKEYFDGRTYHHHDVIIRSRWGHENWSDWAWKIKKWCYIDDILKIE